MDYYAKYLKYKAKYIALKQAAAGRGVRKERHSDCTKEWTSLPNDRKKNVILMELGATPVDEKNSGDKRDLKCLRDFLSSSGYVTTKRYLNGEPSLKTLVVEKLNELKKAHLLA
jgi:hypothetical protein